MAVAPVLMAVLRRLLKQEQPALLPASRCGQLPFGSLALLTSALKITNGCS